jgi:hypothetical protein
MPDPITRSDTPWGTLTCKVPDQAFKKSFADAVKAVAKAELMSDRDQMSPEEWGAAYNAFLDRVAGQDFQFEGRIGRLFINSEAGARFVLEKLMGLKKTDIDRYSERPDFRDLIVAMTEMVGEAMEAARPKKGDSPHPTPTSS